jgi:hypothetical protein
MAVVRFKKRVRRVRVSLRHYICTEGGALRITSRLARELAHREIAAPHFANSIQRMVEVFVETVAGDIKAIEIRPTHARFDQEGKADLHYAAEAMAIILGGSAPKQIGENVVNIQPTLCSRARARETKWRIPASLKKLILADTKGDVRLPVLIPRPMGMLGYHEAVRKQGANYARKHEPREHSVHLWRQCRNRFAGLGGWPVR